MAFFSVRLLIDSTVSRRSINFSASPWPKPSISHDALHTCTFLRFLCSTFTTCRATACTFYFHSSFANSFSYALLRTLHAHLEQHIDRKINKLVSAVLRPKGCCSCKFNYLKSLLPLLCLLLFLYFCVNLQVLEIVSTEISMRSRTEPVQYKYPCLIWWNA